MNIILRSSACCMLFFLAHAEESCVQLPAVHVKVLIDTKPRSREARFTFSSKNGLLVTTSQDPNKKYFFPKNTPVSIKKSSVFINNKKDASTVIKLTPVDGTITLAGQHYAGVMYLFCNEDDIAIVNKLPLEQYLASVLYTEGWPGWPLETYKVLAITCRTYVIWQLRHARKKNKQYHIKATNHHQTYTGLHTNETINQAVRETEGIFIAYNGEPILAMYDACCGGVVPAHTTGIINFSDAPYLARTHACTFCQNCKIYSWQRNISYEKVIERLHETLPKLTQITDIKTKHDRAGIAQEVIFSQKGRRRPFRVSRKIMYNLFPEIKSFSFTCQPNNKDTGMQVSGVGLGHHIGLCQWGAQAMVEQDWNYKQILAFYYPKTHLMRLCTRKKSETPPTAQPTPLAPPIVVASQPNKEEPTE